MHTKITEYQKTNNSLCNAQKNFHNNKICQENCAENITEKYHPEDYPDAEKTNFTTLSTKIISKCSLLLISSFQLWWTLIATFHNSLLSLMSHIFSTGLAMLNRYEGEDAKTLGFEAGEVVTEVKRMESYKRIVAMMILGRLRK